MLPPEPLMLLGMGGCTAIDVVSMLKKQRQDKPASDLNPQDLRQNR